MEIVFYFEEKKNIGETLNIVASKRLCSLFKPNYKIDLFSVYPIGINTVFLEEVSGILLAGFSHLFGPCSKKYSLQFKLSVYKTKQQQQQKKTGKKNRIVICSLHDHKISAATLPCTLARCLEQKPPSGFVLQWQNLPSSTSVNHSLACFNWKV